MTQANATSWLNLGDWKEGMDENKLPPTDELAGKELHLCDTEDRVVNYVFSGPNSLTWEVADGPQKGRSDTETYEAIRVAENIYFVDFVTRTQPAVSMSMALNLDTNKASILRASAPDKESVRRSFVDRLGKGIDLSAISVQLSHANVNPKSRGEAIVPHERTSDLIGKRIEYAYSSSQVYEHIYLNERLYTWHCLQGPEKGLADTEVCDYLRIAPDIYLFTWCEKVMPTFGAVLINLKEKRSNGKTFGLDLISGEIVNFPMGAYARAIRDY